MAVILRPGDDNDLVRMLQARLNRDYPLYSHLVVDGVYGPATTAVVREFQRRAGLLVDDGIAGPQTLGRLGLRFDQPPPVTGTLPFFYTMSGTWATPFQGPPFDVGLAARTDGSGPKSTRRISRRRVPQPEPFSELQRIGGARRH